MRLFPKILNGMANSADPDQTAPSLFAYTILSETLQNIWDWQKLVLIVEWS